MSEDQLTLLTLDLRLVTYPLKSGAIFEHVQRSPLTFPTMPLRCRSLPLHLRPLPFNSRLFPNFPDFQIGLHREQIVAQWNGGIKSRNNSHCDLHILYYLRYLPRMSHYTTVAQQYILILGKVFPPPSIRFIMIKLKCEPLAIVSDYKCIWALYNYILQCSYSDRMCHIYSFLLGILVRNTWFSFPFVSCQVFRHSWVKSHFFSSPDMGKIA